MQTARNIDDLTRFLEDRTKDFTLQRVSLDQTHGWAYDQGVLKHHTGGFFSLIGARFANGQDKLFLYQPQSAVTGLLASYFDHQWHVLLQARAEPGTQGVAQYGPTIQSTLANYLALHGGQPAAYTDHFIRHHPSVRRVIHDSEQLDLGERYLYKTKRLAILECDPDIAVAPGYVWLPQALVSECVGRSYFLNTDLRSLLAVFPWTAAANSSTSTSPNATLAPASALVASSLTRAVRADILGPVCARLDATLVPCALRRLDELEDWEIRADGIFEKQARQGFSVEFYRCETSGREVRAWSQPLINSHGMGRAQLYCRNTAGTTMGATAGTLEVLVRVGGESGLKTGTALLPSVLDYPDFTGAHTPAPGQVLLSTMESDEGGRFLQDISSYQLILVPPEHAAGDDAFWIGLPELKWFLAHSNLCTIQLRGLCSMLLGSLPC